jgi:NADPH:quinone reductase
MSKVCRHGHASSPFQPRLTKSSDWAHITTKKISVNSGDDIAGTVHALGKDAEATGEFHIGDRVAAFHPMLTPGGAYAEFAVAPAHTVFHIPKNISFEGKKTSPKHA